MEINITNYFNSELHYDVSCSQTTHGAFAGTGSYRLACESSNEFMLLDTSDKRQAAIDYFEGFGSWEVEEMNDWSIEELNGLFLQLISGDINEASEHKLEEGFNWSGFEADENLSGHMFEGTDKEIYYYLGS